MNKPEARTAATREAAVPEGRISRFLHFGRAVGELVLSSAALGVSRWAQGDKPDLSQLMLTPANARRLAERLSAMRGAVMKVGQLMSMDAASQGGCCQQSFPTCWAACAMRPTPCPQRN